MKVKFLLVAALAAVSMTALAEVNNSWATDKVYFDDFAIKKGETKQVAIKWNTETPYAAGQADIKLPEGLEFVKGYDEEEEADVLVLNNYSGRAKKHSWSSAWQKKEAGSTEYNYGWIRYVVMHMSNKTIAAGDDEVAYVFVKAAEDAPEGTFTADVWAVHWSTGILGGVGDGDGPTSQFNVTIQATGIQDVTSANVVKAQKVIENGQIYIIAGDKKYNVMGAEVK
ncbi:MAG: hypothetical protein ACI30R_09220 [Sodaliphilus sp.]